MFLVCGSAGGQQTDPLGSQPWGFGCMTMDMKAVVFLQLCDPLGEPQLFSGGMEGEHSKSAVINPSLPRCPRPPVATDPVVGYAVGIQP